ncbi:hypothetical protein CYY_009154 [Polysphondylium violaceum]|uniref:Uncharacterized protein n=1 Tax=Polysphondylium violaceum TaxID=133409 RepID=A0A8J4PPD4_9MYCE|nr:hypothetical protein CYY_009154 [Polysphondylium violaceum]
MATNPEIRMNPNTTHMSIKQIVDECEIHADMANGKLSLKRNFVINNVILVGFVTKIRENTRDNTHNADENPQSTTSHIITIRDGTGQHNITSYNCEGSDFEIGSYYSFLVKPSIRANSNATAGGPKEFRSSTLVGFHKIEDFNEVSYHLSSLVYSYAYSACPKSMEYLKMLVAYLESKKEATSATLDTFLDRFPNDDDCMRHLGPNVDILNDIKNILKSGGFLKIEGGSESLVKALSIEQENQE